MKYSLTTLMMAGLLLLSGPVLASTTTADFGNVIKTGNNFNQFNVSVDGLTINISGWSDTANHSGDGRGDNTIERAKNLDKWNGGWSMQNQDEKNGGYCNTYGHSADNFGTCGYKDYDFFLLSFSEEVSLVSASYSWIAKRAKKTQVSVAALDHSSFTDSDSLKNKTWADLATGHTLKSDYAQVQNASGYYSNFDRSTHRQYSTLWLIGVLNSVFGGDAAWEGNDGMKLSGVSFNKSANDPAQVPEPNTMVMFLIALIGLARFGKRRT
ncbi:exosortase-dependent surface protein XDP1 [Colwellia sp. C1TZA3]|uniref:exosortase-dependent surface protein XDP1 n=1 Tax=Colwellia sp. C1TZA3 TaxID=2508879 RepID=UPI001748DD1F|nr:exosortase-dependent surface protein XDP1 [Colwellia sp. C1TZA3]